MLERDTDPTDPCSFHLISVQFQSNDNNSNSNTNKQSFELVELKLIQVKITKINTISSTFGVFFSPPPICFKYYDYLNELFIIQIYSLTTILIFPLVRSSKDTPYNPHERLLFVIPQYK